MNNYTMKILAVVEKEVQVQAENDEAASRKADNLILDGDFTEVSRRARIVKSEPLKTYMFEVYETVHKTVYVKAKDRDDAWETINDELYDIDMDDAKQCSELREAYCVGEANDA